MVGVEYMLGAEYDKTSAESRVPGPGQAPYPRPGHRLAWQAAASRLHSAHALNAEAAHLTMNRRRIPILPAGYASPPQTARLKSVCHQDTPLQACLLHRQRVDACPLQD